MHFKYIEDSEIKQQEVDFLILLKEHRLIVLVECKANGSKSMISKAVKQLFTISHSLQNNILNITETNWKILKLIYVGKMDPKGLRSIHCDECLTYIINGDNSFAVIMDRMLDNEVAK